MQLVGVALDQQVVLEGGRLALVPVDHQVGDRVLAQHGPLAAGREPGATPAEQAGRVHLVGHRLGGHGQRLAQAVVAAGGQVALEGVGVVVAEPAGDDLGRVGDGHQPSVPSGLASAAGLVCRLGRLAWSAASSVPRDALRPLAGLRLGCFGCLGRLASSAALASAAALWPRPWLPFGGDLVAADGQAAGPAHPVQRAVAGDVLVAGPGSAARPPGGRTSRGSGPRRSGG